MKSLNWTWEREQNNFFKYNKHGGKEWCKDGYQIDFRVDDVL